MNDITESTRVPLGIVWTVGIFALGVVAVGAGWISEVNFSLAEIQKSIARIEKKLGISISEISGNKETI